MKQIYNSKYKRDMMNFGRLFEEVGVDRVIHFLTGGLVCALVTIASVAEEAAWLTPREMCLLPLIGVAVVAVLAFSKEVMDETFDWSEIAAGLLGCAPVELAAVIGAMTM